MAIIVAICIAYLFFVRITGLGIPCFIKVITGFKCPGCGITTMIVEMTRLHFDKAFEANAFLFVTWPVILLEIIYDRYRKSKGKELPAWNIIILVIYLILLIGWGIVRNVI